MMFSASSSLSETARSHPCLTCQMDSPENWSGSENKFNVEEKCRKN
ncbi:hypothetical protein ACFW04_001396 [Cataglyphis niger]